MAYSGREHYELADCHGAQLGCGRSNCTFRRHWELPVFGKLRDSSRLYGQRHIGKERSDGLNDEHGSDCHWNGFRHN
jgi:hypothetical protein